MFSDFRDYVKETAKKKGVTYAMLASQTGVKESTIKCFMCGANDSRRVAEKIADAMGMEMTYKKGSYFPIVSDREKENRSTEQKGD